MLGLTRAGMEVSVLVVPWATLVYELLDQETLLSGCCAFHFILTCVFVFRASTRGLINEARDAAHFGLKVRTGAFHYGGLREMMQ